MKNSSIEWTDHTFNPWTGCAKISAGCKFCYAESIAKRFKTAEWGERGTRRPASDEYWKMATRWDKAALRNYRIERVFCGSMCDVFEEREELEPHRERLWRTVRKTVNLRWLLLTKRAGFGANYLCTKWVMLRRSPDDPLNEAAFGRIWLGVSAENQECYLDRWPRVQQWIHRHDVPLGGTFLSAEPLLGPIRLSRTDPPDWVIAGGESGPKARTLNPDWIRDLRDQCDSLLIPFFFKQWGEFTYESGSPRRVGKKKAGAVLDGREHREFPAFTGRRKLFESESAE